jgi:hypothetical protein
LVSARGTPYDTAGRDYRQFLTKAAAENLFIEGSAHESLLKKL